jgi:hypothetical protein
MNQPDEILIDVLGVPFERCEFTAQLAGSRRFSIFSGRS